MVDGPRGSRTGNATAFPVAIARAASFDVDLERRVGMAIGLEVAAKGGNVLLAPTINLLRHPGWGRAQETYSEDPHHTGAMGAAFISGAQNHVLTSPKHFALNNLENTRFELSAEIDARSLHEVYLPHFKRCVVEARAASPGPPPSCRARDRPGSTGSSRSPTTAATNGSSGCTSRSNPR